MIHFNRLVMEDSGAAAGAENAEGLQRE